MRRPLLLLALTVAACGSGGGAAAVPGSPSAPLTIGYAYLPFVNPVTVTSVQTSAPAVMFGQQFLSADNNGLLLISSDPATTWSISGTSATLNASEPNVLGIPGDPVPTAPPGDTFVQMSNAPGASTVTATIGSKTASIQVISYASLSFGCPFRFYPAFAFDPDRAGVVNSNQLSADLYATQSSTAPDPFNMCVGTPLAGLTDAWHAPFGGTLLPAGSLQAFASISGSQWKNDATSFPPNSSGVLLFKTKEGRIVKAMVPIGPWEVSDTSGNFPY